jgi:hypothetical protein
VKTQSQPKILGCRYREPAITAHGNEAQPILLGLGTTTLILSSIYETLGKRNSSMLRRLLPSAVGPFQVPNHLSRCTSIRARAREALVSVNTRVLPPGYDDKA